MDKNIRKVVEQTGYKSLKSLIFLQNVVKNIKPDCVLELGTYYGCSTIFMAKALKEKGIIYSVDKYCYHPKDSIDISMANVKMCNVADKVVLIEGDTRKPHKEIIKSPELVFMDAAHTEKTLQAEYRTIKKILPDDHVIIIDDYDMPGVESFVKKLINDYELWFILDFHNGMAVLGTNQKYLLAINDAVSKAKKYKQN